MRRNQLIQVFEHESIRVNEQGLTERQFSALCQLSETSSSQFFKIGHRKIVFQQYVGVIQVGDLCIEILPKVDKVENDYGKWRTALLAMLRVTKKFPILSPSQATLSISRGTLFEIFISEFIRGVEQLNVQGLQRKYIQKNGALKFFKGKVEFGRQVSRNAGNETEFISTFTTYDLNHSMHRVIKGALRLVPRICTNSELVAKSKALVNRMDSVSQFVQRDLINAKQFHGRHWARYKSVLNYAEQILKAVTHIPESGSIPTVAILFDMNRLFEQYVLACMKSASKKSEYLLKGQARKNFYERRTIKPDILASCGGVNYVIDTKWKLLNSPEPSDSDLKQIFAYNNYFDCTHSILLYPDTGILISKTGKFHQSMLRNEKEVSQYCTVEFVSLFDSRGSVIPAKQIGELLIGKLESLSEREVKTLGIFNDENG